MAAMRNSSLLLAVAIVVAAGAGGPGRARAGEQVEIPHGEQRLPAVLYRPQGDGPFPSAVALHGCGGLFNSTGKIFARLNDWGERLAAAGIAAVFPDSFGPRGLSSQCRVSERRVR